MINFKFSTASMLKFDRELKAKIKSYRQDVQQAVNQVAVDIHRDAVANIDRNKTVDTGILRSKLRIQFDDPAIDQPNANVHNLSDYAPFVEFGTKSKVSVPAELKSYAMQFKGSKKGSFNDLLKNIERWAYRKGLPTEAVFPIALKIARDGTSAKPFLYPAFVMNKKKLEKLIKKINP